MWGGGTAGRTAGRLLTVLELPQIQRTCAHVTHTPLPSTHRDAVAAELGLDPATLELSMGMSGDFEAAVRLCWGCAWLCSCVVCGVW